MHQFEAKLSKHGENYGTIWYYYVAVDKKVAALFEETSRRVICTINDTASFHCALMPDGKGDFFININKEIRKKLGIDETSILKINLKKDASEYGIPMPEEFKEVLFQDPEGDKLFHKLTKGKQRSLLYIIGKPKSPDLKIKKGLIVLDYLKSTGGKLDFKELNEAFKLSNR